MEIKLHIGALLTFILAAFVLGMSVIILNQEPINEIVCDHPEWKDSGYAAVSAGCTLNKIDGIPVKVTILD